MSTSSHTSNNVFPSPVIINESNQRRCAACKYLRRRCSRDCVLSPYFPASMPHRFACVHKIFGASNVARMLQQVTVHQRAQAAEAMSAEAYWRVQDPVYGSVGIINLLQQHICMNQRELASTRARIAIYAAQQEAHVAHGPAQFDRSPRGDNFVLDTTASTSLEFNHFPDIF